MSRLQASAASPPVLRSITASATIGGTSSGAGNVLSGNSVDGIDVYSSGTATILGNVFSENVGSGIAVSGAATIGGTGGGAGNAISGSTYGYGIIVLSGTATIIGNAIVGNGDGILTFGATTIGGTSSGAGNAISGNTNGIVAELSTPTILGNTLTGNSADGIWVEYGGGATITDDSITGNSTGILVGDDASDTSLVTAQHDDLSGNTTAGMTNNQTNPAYAVAAAADWWGSAHGPTTTANPGGNGTNVSSNVSFSPWIGVYTAGTGPGFQPTGITVYAVPTRLVLVTQPAYSSTSPSNAGTAFTTQPVIEAEDGSGNLGYNFNGTLGIVNFSLTALSGTGTLLGTTTGEATNGTLNLTSSGNLGITAPGEYQLIASGPNFTTGVTAVTSNQININYATPTLTSVMPAQVAVGTSSPLSVTLTGTGFYNPQTTVTFDSYNLTADITSQSATSIVVSVPASLFTAIHTYTVSATNPVINTGGGGSSNSESFAVEPVPTTIYVNTAWTGDSTGTAVTWTDNSTHYIGYDAFATIQPAVSDVASAGTVNIAAGTYVGLIGLTQDVTLAGAAPLRRRSTVAARARSSRSPAA